MCNNLTKVTYYISRFQLNFEYICRDLPSCISIFNLLYALCFQLVINQTQWRVPFSLYSAILSDLKFNHIHVTTNTKINITLFLLPPYIFFNSNFVVNYFEKPTPVLRDVKKHAKKKHVHALFCKMLHNYCRLLEI